MQYLSPVVEQRFVLEHVVRLAELTADGGFAAATPDIVDAVLEGAAAFASANFAPLDRCGDVVGARWTPDGVVMPPGYREAYRAFVESGWGSIAAPLEHGGQGLPFALGTAVLESLGTANFGFTLIAILTAGSIEALAAHALPEQQVRWLPHLVSGEWNGTMNLTEAQAGSDLGALRTRAERQPDGRYKLKGQKIFISFGDHDLTENILHLVLARLSDAGPGTKGLSLFVVPKFRSDGVLNDVRTVSIEHKLGLHASPTCVLAFGDEGTCVGEIVGREGEGMRAMFTMMNNARLMVGLQGVQVAERATQAAVAFATERVQSPRAGGLSRDPVRIIDHPDVRRMLLRMKTLTAGARALVYFAAGEVDRAHLGSAAARARLDLLTPLAKAYATDVGVEVASLGIQVHGGMGFIEETGAAQHYRDARIAPIYEGTNGIQAADLVGRKLVGDGGAALCLLLAEIRAEASSEAPLTSLVDVCTAIAEHLLHAAHDDRLAGSYPFLTMCAVAAVGWLMMRQRAAASGSGHFMAMKRTTADFYLQRIVPEALGLKASALGGSTLLYELAEEAFAA